MADINEGRAKFMPRPCPLCGRLAARIVAMRETREGSVMLTTKAGLPVGRTQGHFVQHTTIHCDSCGARGSFERPIETLDAEVVPIAPVRIEPCPPAMGEIVPGRP